MLLPLPNRTVIAKQAAALRLLISVLAPLVFTMASAFSSQIDNLSDGRVRATSVPGLKAAYLPIVFPSSHSSNLLSLREWGSPVCLVLGTMGGPIGSRNPDLSAEKGFYAVDAARSCCERRRLGDGESCFV
jgi:hypothetical protein